MDLSDNFLTSTNGSTEDEVANKNSIRHFLTWLSSNGLSKTTAPAGPYSSMARSNASDSASSVLQATTTLPWGTKNSSPFAAGNLPAHVVPSFREIRKNTPSSLRNKKGAAGRGSKYPGALIFEGPCKHNGRTNKTDLKRMWQNPDNEDKCTSWCQVVLTQDQVVKFATNSENVALSLTVKYMGRCIHEVGREKGTLSGAERKRKANEVNGVN